MTAQNLSLQQQHHSDFQIHLTPLEQRICDLVLQVATIITDSGTRPPVNVRIAGGWVRDKLLGKDTYDLDFALDSMTGYEFALAVGEYMEKSGLEVRHIAKIEQNPDKSKHLETATTKVFGQEVDFVNLRTETYRDHSRIPEAEFGTPQQDAERRDITINTLFYNLHTRSVEDFTGKGLVDLKNGLIRTPLPPYQTFLDDPLRILRVMRFASRFGYSIHPEIFTAAQNPEIENCFAHKLSKERIGTEIDKMIAGPDPLRSLRLIHDFKFYDLVFEKPETMIIESEIDARVAIRQAEAIFMILSSPEICSKIYPTFTTSFTPLQIRRLYLSAAVLPYGTLTYMEKKKEFPVVRYIILHSLKHSVHDAEHVTAIILPMQRIIETVGTCDQQSRKQLGLFIRDIGIKCLHHDWILAIVNALAYEIATSDYTKVDDLVQKYSKFRDRLMDEDLEHAFEMKHLLSGKDICQLLGIKPGPQVGKILEELIEWQLDNPESDRADAESWILHSFK